jgi:hypothetical protein
MPFDSREYAWKDLRTNILGRTVEFTNIKYTVKKDKSFVRGKGSKPLHIAHGNEEVSGEVTLLQSEVIALTAIAKAVNPKYKITDIEFDIICAYGDADNGLTTDIVKTVSIQEYEKGMKNGDPNMEVPLKFIALDVAESVL